MARPCSLVVSCCDKDPKELVQLILGHDDLPSPIPLIESIEAYPWFIETKYYTADIYLCTVKNKTIGTQEFAESVQAVVIYFDSKLESTFDKVKEWITFIKEFSPEVQLLVCENFTESTVDRQTVQQWCLKNNFELVELYPDIDEDDCDDDFPETTGIKRVIQALHSHLWPNLELKNEPGFKKLNLESVLDASPKELPSDVSTFNSTNDLEKSFKDLNVAKSEVEECNEAQGATESDQSIKEKAKFSDVMPSDFDVSHILGDEESSTQSFELLFQQFHQMKERAQNLPFEERKTYAEQVALAFWRAIGGDEEEIEGIEHE